MWHAQKKIKKEQRREEKKKDWIAYSAKGGKVFRQGNSKSPGGESSFFFFTNAPTFRSMNCVQPPLSSECKSPGLSLLRRRHQAQDAGLVLIASSCAFIHSSFSSLASSRGLLRRLLASVAAASASAMFPREKMTCHERYWESCFGKFFFC